MYMVRAQKMGIKDNEADVFTVRALFSTLTNVNFDPARFMDYLKWAKRIRDKVKGFYEDACKKTNLPIETLEGPAAWEPAAHC